MPNDTPPAAAPARPPTHSTAGFQHRPRNQARHVWVGTQPAPGVLIEWRQHAGHWQAHVAYVDRSQVIIGWLPTDSVRPTQ